MACCRRSRSAIAEALGLDRKTVRRYAHAATPDDLPVGTGKRGNRVQLYLGYLHQRWNEGCTDAVRLCGSERTVRRHLQTLRASGQPAPTVSQELTVRQATRLLTSHPDHLDENGTLRLKELLSRCPELDGVADCVRTFAEMMAERRGQDLNDWLEQAKATGFPSLSSLTRGLRQDFEVVTAGLTLEWNSGRVEGNVNRFKRIKRDGMAAPASTSSASRSSTRTEHSHAQSRLHREWISTSPDGRQRGELLAAYGENSRPLTIAEAHLCEAFGSDVANCRSPAPVTARRGLPTRIPTALTAGNDPLLYAPQTARDPGLIRAARPDGRL